MNHKPLTTDKQITEFLIQEIEEKKYLEKQFTNYFSICHILRNLFQRKMITLSTSHDYEKKFIHPYVNIDKPFLFPKGQIQPRIEFLKEILENLP